MPLLRGLNGEPDKWHETEPYVWTDAAGKERLAAEVVDGRVTRFSAGMLGPIIMLERAPTDEGRRLADASGRREPHRARAYRDFLAHCCARAPPLPQAAPVHGTRGKGLSLGAHRRARLAGGDARLGRNHRTSFSGPSAHWCDATTGCRCLMGQRQRPTAGCASGAGFAVAIGGGWMSRNVQRPLDAVVEDRCVARALTCSVRSPSWPGSRSRCGTSFVWSGKRRWTAKIWSVVLAVATAVMAWIAIAYHLVGISTNY